VPELLEEHCSLEKGEKKCAVLLPFFHKFAKLVVCYGCKVKIPMVCNLAMEIICVKLFTCRNRKIVVSALLDACSEEK
jgi:hypothetical protein